MEDVGVLSHDHYTIERHGSILMLFFVIFLSVEDLGVTLYNLYTSGRCGSNFI